MQSQNNIVQNYFFYGGIGLLSMTIMFVVLLASSSEHAIMTAQLTITLGIVLSIGGMILHLRKRRKLL
jgi:hypothetical protein